MKRCKLTGKIPSISFILMIVGLILGVSLGSEFSVDSFGKLVTAAAVQFPTEVGGIIWEDTTWTPENSPYEITETVQIPSGVTLTIEPGAIITKPSSGDMFLLHGAICAHGTSQEPIVIDGGGNSKIVYTDGKPGYGDFQYCTIQNGYNLWDRWGHLDLRYCTLVNLYGVIYWQDQPWCHTIGLDRPSGESNIEFNRFINTGAIWSFDDDYGTNIRYNLFQGLLTPLEYLGGADLMVVKYNSFIDTKGMALYLYSTNGLQNIDATENYWGTLDTNIIDQMIYDRNDDIRSGNFIDYLPILTEPHPDTPKADSSPITPCNPSPVNDASGVSIDADLSWTGGDPDAGDTVTYDVYFGTSSSPPLKETIGPYPATQSSITYDPGTLIDGTRYYWQIVARDNYGITAEGSEWDFTTGKTGDVDGDGNVNVLDMVRVGQHLGEIGPPSWIPEDANEDGVINVLDMIMVGQHWTG